MYMFSVGLIYWFDKEDIISQVPSAYIQTFTSDVNKIFGASWLTINNKRKLPDFSSLLDQQWGNVLSY